MNLATHSKLDLPIYSEGDVAWTKSEIRAAAQSGQPEFIRRTYLEYGGPEKDLNIVLAMADRVLNLVCECMKVEKVDCSWGLAPISQSNRERLGENYHNDHELLPAGYGLVAVVENIAGAHPVNDYWNDRISGWNPSGFGITIDDGHFVSNHDLRSEQFVLRPPTEELDFYYGKSVIVDIEPRLRVRDGNYLINE